VIEGVLKTANRNEKSPADARDTACVLSAGTWSQRVNALLERVGGSDVPVLLRGETGVGKEVLARRLHEQSKRAGRPFLKLNCAALPSELVESELFGYERGAFTGALKNTPGKFEMANGGTILLDEIGDMDFKLQAKLLQVLQDKEFLRLGAKDTCRVDVRVMAATHCNLEEAIEAGRFREDLYYRLNIVEVHVPPLRERKDEILTLSEFFLQKYAPNETPQIPSALQQPLIGHDWPGNVRELENVIRKFLVFRSVEMIAADLKQKARPTSGGKILRSPVPIPDSANGSSPRGITPTEPDDAALTPDHVSSAGSGTSFAPAYAPPAPGRQLSNGVSEEPAVQASVLAQVDLARKRAEVDVILSALHSTLWNRKQAAKLLNIDYKALLYKMKKLGIGEKMPNGTAPASRNSN
jgi:two-component system response regulator AtoC